ncbi:MAG: flagellar biosynthesis protein FlgA, partial [Alphaproteobacteria bacterium]|nr:flagellar biosynthesis protein FlgA [Alphaproteobacteria bacterium]
GQLHHKGQVEVVSSLERDGRPVPHDIRWGVWVVFEAHNDYVARCFREYGLQTDASGRYACMYKRWHLIGLEVGVSVAAVALRGEATGVPTGFRADAVATAKRALKPGEVLDGEGGYTVYGRLMPAERSLALGGLPLGLAHGLTLSRAIPEGQPLTWDDVNVAAAGGILGEAIATRRDMEESFKMPSENQPPQAAVGGRGG